MKAQIINDSIITENFSKSYPFINKYLFENGDYESSRNGDTKEILNFKTGLTNPYNRCVGNNERNINIFFLLAEAMWIVLGRKDVEFLKIFNDRMSDYSDDGKVFHAPYGFRIRNYGVSSFGTEKPTTEQQNHAYNQISNGEDQLIEALKLLEEDHQTRRVVMSIWNPELDLGTKSKDLPCNDMVMFKIRKSELHTTIANRSNDLHWGLPTNIFQFSFLSEVMSNVLGIKLGTQVHNSQSLHFYMDNEIASNMYENLQLSGNNFDDIYDFTEAMKIDMKFTSQTIVKKVSEIDFYLNQIINSILRTIPLDESAENSLKEFSTFLWFSYKLLWIYSEYKFISKPKNDDLKLEYFNRIKTEFSEFKKYDIYALALNFFAARIDADRLDESIIGKL